MTAAARALEAARDRTRAVLGLVDDAALVAQHSTLMSPLVWDLAHVANYEEQWLVRALGGPPLRPDIDHLYDAFEQPRAGRVALPLLDPAEAWAYADEVRTATLDLLGRCDPDDPDPLRRHHFVHGMVAQHEQQHLETMLATLQLVEGPGARPDLPAADLPIPDLPIPGRPGPLAGRRPPTTEVLVPAGPATIGTDEPWALDNERPAHRVEVPAFRIDAHPVTNGDHLAFVAAGGYDDPTWWTDDGWKWRVEADLTAPQFWRRESGSPTGWVVRRFGHDVALNPDEPVQHVCWFEADAHARWAGKRLPTEHEWERAARWSPDGDAPGRLPDGANLGGARWGPAPVGAHPDSRSPSGCVQLFGDVWEWTSSDFVPWPGFRSFPYPEYSEVFFPEPGRAGRFKVLRGGSWATAPVAMRPTFRNWDFPIRRQIFAGFRCARDA